MGFCIFPGSLPGTNTFPWDSVVCFGILSLLHGLQGFSILCPHFPFSPECRIHTQTDGAIFHSVSEFSTLLWSNPSFPFCSETRHSALCSLQSSVVG